jgi:signal transduction histidine kinase
MHATPTGTQAVGVVEQLYEHEETRDLVALVNDAAELVHTKGEAAFSEFRSPGSRWRTGETYIFVLDTNGMMLVHTDASMEGKNQLDLKDVNGKPIIRGLIDAVTTSPARMQGWFHYQWPVPGQLFPRWKSSFVRLANAPSGSSYVVGSGVYNDRMERPFVVDMVHDAVARIEQQGEAAFPLFRDPTGPFLVKDACIRGRHDRCRVGQRGLPQHRRTEPVGLQGRGGKLVQRDIQTLVRTSGSGWVDHMWPKPGRASPTQKSAFVSMATVKGKAYVVGCGVYLAAAPTAPRIAEKLTAPELMTLVRDGAALLEEKGEKAFPEFRDKGARWFRGETYFFVMTMDGTRVFHGTEPEAEGHNEIGLKDVMGKPFIRMMIDAVARPGGEGWVHYMYPQPNDIFPTWKSAFVKRVTFPSGKQHFIGCGIYNMQMDVAFIEDLVDKAATLVEQQGTGAFAQLRDKAGPFFFMDTYVFVMNPDGTELVNPVLPNMEGRKLIDLRDLKGKAVVKDEIAAAMKEGKAWLDCFWYRPGGNTQAMKRTYVRKVQAGQEVFIVGSGIYVD